MSDQFLGEIRLLSFNFAPQGWALCNGQLLLINQNQALFKLLGTTYGGNGTTTFALPDFRGRVAQHVGAGYVQGQRVGEQAHTLTIQEMPIHTHVLQAQNTPANSSSVPAQWLAQAQMYTSSTGNLAAADPGDVSNTGGSQAHENMQPYLVIAFVIALQGVFPS